MNEPGLTVTRSSSALNTPNWDSLGHIDLIEMVEMHFKVKFALGELHEMKNRGRYGGFDRGEAGRVAGSWRYLVAVLAKSLTAMYAKFAPCTPWSYGRMMASRTPVMWVPVMAILARRKRGSTAVTWYRRPVDSVTGALFVKLMS